MRQVLCPVLVRREEEVQVLLDGLDRAADGHGGAFFVVGEAGVGKSRLVREVSQLASSRGLPVLTGRAVPGGVPVAFRPLAEAVLGGLRRRGQLDLPELRPFRPALGRLVPEWLPREPDDASSRRWCSARGCYGCSVSWTASMAVFLSWKTCTGPTPSHWQCWSIWPTTWPPSALSAWAHCVRENGAGRNLVETLVARRAARAVQLARLGDEATIRLART